MDRVRVTSRVPSRSDARARVSQPIGPGASVSEPSSLYSAVVIWFSVPVSLPTDISVAVRAISSRPGGARPAKLPRPLRLRSIVHEPESGDGIAPATGRLVPGVPAVRPEAESVVRLEPDSTLPA